jgi:hypothetical protein
MNIAKFARAGLVATVVATTGCASMTVAEKRAVGATVITILAVGAYKAYEADHGHGELSGRPGAIAVSSKSSCAFNIASRFCAGQPVGK